MTEPLNLRIKRLREQKGISGAEMARLISVAPSTYREWEKGRGMSAPPFLKISQVLAISVNELITGEAPLDSGLADELEDIEKKVRELKLKVISLR